MQHGTKPGPYGGSIALPSGSWNGVDVYCVTKLVWL